MSLRGNGGSDDFDRLAGERDEPESSEDELVAGAGTQAVADEHVTMGSMTLDDLRSEPSRDSSKAFIPWFAAVFFFVVSAILAYFLWAGALRGTPEGHGKTGEDPDGMISCLSQLQELQAKEEAWNRDRAALVEEGAGRAGRIDALQEKLDSCEASLKAAAKPVKKKKRKKRRSR